MPWFSLDLSPPLCTLFNARMLNKNDAIIPRVYLRYDYILLFVFFIVVTTGLFSLVSDALGASLNGQTSTPCLCPSSHSHTLSSYLCITE